jgi:hypothetical protein
VDPLIARITKVVPLASDVDASRQLSLDPSTQHSALSTQLKSRP